MASQKLQYLIFFIFVLYELSFVLNNFVFVTSVYMIVLYFNYKFVLSNFSLYCKFFHLKTIFIIVFYFRDFLFGFEGFLYLIF